MTGVCATKTPINMARPRVYSTEEERRVAIKASYHTYNSAHRAERAAHNQAYCHCEYINQCRRDLRVARTLALRNRVGTDPVQITIDE